MTPHNRSLVMESESKCSIEHFAKSYNNLYLECLDTTLITGGPMGGIEVCVTQAASKSIKELNTACTERGPNCSLSSYGEIWWEDNKFKGLPIDIVEILTKKSLDDGIETVKKGILIPMAGCLVGGSVTSVIGGTITGVATMSKGGIGAGVAGATLGASISFPIGCGIGAEVASEAYIVYKGFQKIQDGIDFYHKLTGKFVQILEKLRTHHQACNANLASRVEQTFISSHKQTPISWDKEESNESNPPIKAFLLARKVSSTTASNHPKSFSWSIQLKKTSSTDSQRSFDELIDELCPDSSTSMQNEEVFLTLEPIPSFRPDIKVHVPLDKLDNANMGVTIPVGQTNEIGISVILASPQKFSLSASTTINGSQVGTVINQQHIKNSSISVTRAIDENVNLGVVVNPSDPKNVHVSGSANLMNGVNIGVSLNLRHFQKSTASIAVPVYGIPIGLTTKLNSLKEARLTAGFPGTPLQISLPIRQIIQYSSKIAKQVPVAKEVLKGGKKLETGFKKAFGLRRKKKHKHHTYQTSASHSESHLTPEFVAFINAFVKLHDETVFLELNFPSLEREVTILSQNTDSFTDKLAEMNTAILSLENELPALEKQVQTISESIEKLDNHSRTLAIQNEKLGQHASKLGEALRGKITPEEASRLRAKISCSKQ